MSKTVLFQTIQFSIGTQFSSIWPIDSTLSGATALGLSEPGSDGNGEGSQSFSITETSLLGCLGSSVVMPQTILPWRNRRCPLSAPGTWKPEEEKDARGVTCFMEENEISPREVARFDEHKRD